MSDLLDAFVADYPDYLSTHAVDSLRAREYRRLDDQQHAYLDYTGASLHAESQVLEHAALLNEHIFGNPHSASPSSHNMTKLVEQTRRAVLDWFNAPPDEYVAIFTANATGALKHVGESYPFSQGAGLLLTVDNHNSVNGIREFARAKGAPVDYAPLTVPERNYETVLIQNPRTAHSAMCDRVVRRLEGVVIARDYSLLEYNVPRAKLPEAEKITPGFKSPTVSALEDPTWCAVRAMGFKTPI